MKLLRRFSPRLSFDIITLLFIALYTIAAILVSLHRFWQFEVFYYDFGIYDQAIWNVAHFRPPIIDHFVIPGKVIFADHFSPSMFLLTPIYWLTSQPEALLITQAVTVGLSACVLFALGKKVLSDPFPALSITIAYLLFIGTQNALIADIHEATFMMLPLMITLYAIVTKKIRLYWLSFVIVLGFKESSAFLGLGLAILMYIQNGEFPRHSRNQSGSDSGNDQERAQWKKTAFTTAALSILWGYLTTQVIIPYFYGQRYFYTPAFDTNPLIIFSTLFDDPVKRKTLMTSLLSFGLLPLLYPPAWPLILQDTATRFMQKDFALRWGLGLHYSAQMATILAFSSVMAVRKLGKKISGDLQVLGAVCLIVFTLFLHQFNLHGPLGLAYNPAFYAHTKNFRFLNDLITRVPKGTSVMTMNNIAPHMIHTYNVYLLRTVYDDFMPDYFVLDLRDGQNFNNFFGVDIETLTRTLRQDTRYEAYYTNGEQVIYKRGID